MNKEACLITIIKPPYFSKQHTNQNIVKHYRAYPGLEFVVANTLAIWRKLEPNEINLSQGFSQKVVFNSLPNAHWG